MTALNKITGAAAPQPAAPQRSEGAAASKALTIFNREPLTPVGSQTAGAVQPSPRAAPATYPSRYGTSPRCEVCERPGAVCICGVPEPEQEHFRPGLNRDPDRHWIEL